MYDKGMILISCVLAANALVNGSGGEYSESKRVDWQRENEASRQVREGCTCVDVESYCVCYGISESNTTGRVTIKSTYFNFYVKYLIVLQWKGALSVSFAHRSNYFCFCYDVYLVIQNQQRGSKFNYFDIIMVKL